MSPISGSAGTFTSTLTPNSDGTVQIYVFADSFEDEAGNRNAANSETFTFTYDSTVPTPTISSAECSSGDTTNDAALSLTFEASETIQNFVESDITVTVEPFQVFPVFHNQEYCNFYTKQ